MTGRNLFTKKWFKYTCLFASVCLWLAAAWCLLQFYHMFNEPDFRKLSQAQSASVLAYYEDRLRETGTIQDETDEEVKLMAKDAYARDLALEREANKAGYQLSDAGIDEQNARWEAIRKECLDPPTTQSKLIQQKYGEAMTTALFRNTLEREVLAADFLAHKQAEFSMSVLEEEIAAYCQENPGATLRYTVQCLYLADIESVEDVVEKIASAYTNMVPTTESFEDASMSVFGMPPAEVTFTAFDVDTCPLPNGVCKWIMEHPQSDTTDLMRFSMGETTLLLRIDSCVQLEEEILSEAIRELLGAEKTADWLATIS